MDDQENIKQLQQVDSRTRKIIKIGQRSACDGSEGEWIAQGWCEGLEFAIKVIKKHK